MAHMTDRADRFAERLVDRHRKALEGVPDPAPRVSPAPKPEGDIDATLAEVRAMRKRLKELGGF